MADEADVPEGPEDGPDDVVAAKADAEAVEEASADSGADAKRPWSHVRLALTVGLAAVVALAGHRLLAQAHDQRRLGGDRVDHGGDRCIELSFRHDAVDEAERLRGRRIDHLAGQQHLHGLGLADGARQALGAAGAGDDAEQDLRLPELGIVAGDAEVAA